MVIIVVNKIMKKIDNKYSRIKHIYNEILFDYEMPIMFVGFLLLLSMLTLSSFANVIGLFQYEWYYIIGSILIMTELMFWKSSDKPFCESVFWFTVGKKFKYFGISTVIFLVVNALILCVGWIIKYVEFAVLLNYLTIGAAVILIFYTYIKLNSLKYKEKKVKKSGK